MFNSQDNHTTSPRPQSSAHSTETVQFQNETTDITDKQHRESLCGQNNDVSELHGFDVEGGSVDTENEENHQKTKHDPRNDTKTADNKGDNKKAKQKNKYQSTLTRQAGFQNENDPREMLEAPSFDLRTEDGDILVVVSNLDTEGDGQEHVIDIEEGDIDIDCEENLEYSSTRLQQGHGSASSVHSEPDNADNCSISVGLSVSSLGSDNEEELNDLEIEEHAKEDKEEEEQRHQVKKTLRWFIGIFCHYNLCQFCLLSEFTIFLSMDYNCFFFSVSFLNVPVKIMVLKKVWKKF